jgi:hypothetical protein
MQKLVRAITESLPKAVYKVFFEKAEREDLKDLQTWTSRKRKLEQYQRDIFKEIREDRKWYKDFRIDLSDMSEAFAALDRQQKLKKTSRLKGFRTTSLSEIILRARKVIPRIEHRILPSLCRALCSSPPLRHPQRHNAPGQLHFS